MTLKSKTVTENIVSSTESLGPEISGNPPPAYRPRTAAVKRSPFTTFQVNFPAFLEKMQTKAESIDLGSMSELLSRITSDITSEGIDFSLSLITLFYRIYRLENLTDMFFAGLEFLKSVCGIQALLDGAQFAYDFLTHEMGILYNKIISRPITTESAPSEVLRCLRSNMSLVLDSDIVTSIRDFVLALVSFRVFEKDTAKKITGTLGPARPTTVLELADVCLSSVISVLSVSEQLVKGVSVTEVFTSNDPVGSFITTVDELESVKDLTYSGLPVEGKVCRRELLAKVISTVKVGEALHDGLPHSAPQRKGVHAALRKVRLLKSTFLNMMQAESRPMPACVCIAGMPGIGKGALIEYISMMWSHVKGREFDSSHIYHRLATETYWSGYEGGSTPIIHYSEPGSLNRNIAKAKGDPVISEFLSVVDNQPYMCNMADVESKGKVYAIPELVVMDCNDASMNLDVLVNNPAAVKRRILYITPVVKPEFVQKGTCRLDQAKSLASDTPKLDRWLFTVHIMEPLNIRESAMVVLLQSANIYELSEFLRTRFTLHVEQQDARVKIFDGENVSDYLSTEVDLTTIMPEDLKIHTESNPNPTVPDLSIEQKEKDFSPSLVLPSKVPQLLTEKLDKIYAARVRFYVPPPVPSTSEKLALAYTTWISPMLIYLCFYSKVWAGRLASLLRVFCSFITVLFWTLSIGAVWCVPQNVFLKLMGLQACKPKHRYSLDRFNWEWNQLKAHFGFQNTFIVRPLPSYKVSTYLALLVGVGFLFKTYRMSSIFTEGAVVSASKDWSDDEIDEEISSAQEKSGAVRPPPRRKPNNARDWDADPKRAPHFITRQEKKNEPSKVRQAVLKNVRTVIVTGNKSIETKVLGLRGDLALINRHSIGPSTKGMWRAVVKIDTAQAIGIIKCQLDENEMEQVDGDVWLVRIRGAKFKDICPYIATDYIVPPVYGYKGTIHATPILVKPHTAITAEDPNWGPIKVDRVLSYEWKNHAIGMCGSPVMAEYSGGCGVIGLHIAGSPTTMAFAQTVRYPDIEKAANILDRKSCTLRVNSEGALRFSPSITGLVPVNDRSPFKYESTPGLRLYGKLDGYHVQKPGKSNLRSTQFVHCAEALTGVSPFREDGKPLYAAPPFTHGTNPETGEYCAPHNNFLKKAGVIKESLVPSILRDTVSLVENYIVDSLEKRGVTKISPVPLEIAQNGDPEDFYMRAMKQSTSGGFPWPGSKRNHSEPVELDFKSDAYMPIYSVKEQVVEQLNAYMREEDASPILGAQLKDEARSWEKIIARKTRVFCMSPYESTLVNRMYLMPFYSLMVEHGDIFHTSIGINMHSTDVDDMVDDLRGFSDKFMEGDYGGYDTSMPYDIGLAANTIVHNVCERLGYNDEALRYVRGILSDNLFPTIVMGGDLFAAPALQPSGKYATAEDNSLRGLVLLVYAWISECTPSGRERSGRLGSCQFTPEDFFRLVRPKIYGDDMVAGVKKRAQKHFNNITYQTFCKEVYGLDFTNAQKTLTMSAFLKFEDISFLKRTFVYRDDLGHWVAPLELSSIMKSICYYLPSKSVTVEEQLIDSCTSALRELFFHLDEEEYEKRRFAFAIKCAQIFERDHQDIIKVFPRFDKIQTQCYGDPLEEVLPTGE